jgi:methionyl-tRNA synthetase
MVDRYRGGRLTPSPLGPGALAGVAESAAASYRQAMDRYALHEACAAAFRIVDATNEYIASQSPWILAKDPAHADRLSQVLYDATEALRVASVLLTPVMPGACGEILRRVGETTVPSALTWDRDVAWQGTVERTSTKAGAIWPRLDTNEPPAPEGGSGQSPRIDVTTPEEPNRTAPLAAPGTEAAAPASKQETGPDRISIEDFMKVELRVARVVAAERVPKSKKLVKLLVDAGSEQRTLVAGIADAYEPEALVGRTVVIVANLKPATLMGIESNGMVLAASPDGGKPQLIAIDGEPPAPGSRVR